MLRAELRSSPRVELEEGRAALKLFLTIHVGAGSPEFQSFLSVSAVSERCRTGPRPLLPSTAAAGTGLCRREQGERSMSGGHCTDGFITSQCSELKWDGLLALILPSLFSSQDVTAGLLLSVTDTRMMISAAVIE